MKKKIKDLEMPEVNQMADDEMDLESMDLAESEDESMGEEPESEPMPPVDLSEISDDDLIAEVKSRGLIDDGEMSDSEESMV